MAPCASASAARWARENRRSSRRSASGFRDQYDLFVITNDIYTKEDQLILTRAQALPAERIIGPKTGACPHTAIREDASMNLAAVAEMSTRFPRAQLCFIESGGDNLAPTFSPELADLTIYVIDVAGGEKIPRKGGGIRSAAHARRTSLSLLELTRGGGVEGIAAFIIEQGGLLP